MSEELLVGNVGTPPFKLGPRTSQRTKKEGTELDGEGDGQEKRLRKDTDVGT